MSNITDAEFIAEIKCKQASLKPGHAVVAVLQTMYPQYGAYTIATNMEKRRALAVLLERSASKVTGRGTLRQMAFYFERGRGNQIWQRFCSFVKIVAAGGDTKFLGTVTDVSRRVGSGDRAMSEQPKGMESTRPGRTQSRADRQTTKGRSK